MRNFQSPCRVAPASSLILCRASRKLQNLPDVQPSSFTLWRFVSSGLTAWPIGTVHSLHNRVHQKWFVSARNGNTHLWQFLTCHHPSTNTVTKRRIVFDYQSISFASAFPMLHYLDNWEWWAVHPPCCPVLSDITPPSHKCSRTTSAMVTVAFLPRAGFITVQWKRKARPFTEEFLYLLNISCVFCDLYAENPLTSTQWLLLHNWHRSYGMMEASLLLEGRLTSDCLSSVFVHFFRFL